MNLKPARLVEPLRGLDESVVALVDEVRERQALTLVPLGHGDDEAEVRAHHLVERLLVALLDAHRQLDLVVGRQERDLTDLLEILVQHPLGTGDIHGSGGQERREGLLRITG